MTDHIFGEDSYVECDRYHVVSVSDYEDRFSNLDSDLYTKQDCYCGKQATHVARVGFYTVIEERDNWWDRTQNRTFKVHRCDDHRFEENNA